MKLGEKAAELGNRPISEFMTSQVESLPPTAKIAFAVHRMDHGGYRHVPVVNDKSETVGIFSVRDILSYLSKSWPGKVELRPGTLNPTTTDHCPRLARR